MKLEMMVLMMICGFLCGCLPADQQADSGVKPILPAAIEEESLLHRTIVDPRVRRYILPSRVLWKSSDRAVQNPEVLLQKRSGQVTLDASNPCVLDSSKGPASILLDFGTELHGGVQIMVWHTKNNKPVQLRVTFGESASEAMSSIGGEKNATNDHAVRDQKCYVPWLGTHEIGNTGFRFVRISLEDKDSFVQFKSIRAVFIYRDLEYAGSFRCSDQRLNKIWQTGAYTVHLNMQDYLWDGIKRDRLVWIGDMHPETMTIFSVFGADPVIPKSLDLIRDETPLGKWMNGISSYSMWWILIHHEWYMFTGDAEYLARQKQYMVGLLNQLAKCIDRDNSEAMPPGRFLDWPSNANKPAIHAGLHSLLIMTLSAGADMCDILHESNTARLCRSTVQKLRKHIPDPNGSKQAAALMALAKVKDAAELNKSVMAPGGAKRMSTFYGYYVLQARAMAGDYQGAVDVIRQYWGAMLDRGATTFWEDFDIDWLENSSRIDELVPEGKKDLHGDYGNYCYKGFRHSLCHGWASGPTAWMTEHIIGIKILAPGCKKVQIRPNLADLDWAQGTFPTPYGIIKVKHTKNPDGSIKTSIDSPEQIEVIR